MGDVLVPLGATVPDAWAGEPVELVWDSGSEATVWRDGRAAAGRLQLELARAASEVAPPVASRATAGERIELDGRDGVQRAGWATSCPDPGFDRALPLRWRLGRTWERARRRRARLRAGTPPARLVRCGARRASTREAWEHALGPRGAAPPWRPSPDLEPAWGAALLAELDALRERTGIAGRPRAAGGRRRAILGRAARTPRRGDRATPSHADRPRPHRHRLAVAAGRDRAARSCARSANQLALMDRYPEHRFAASSAQHYAWLEEDAPGALRARARAGRARAAGRSSAAPGSSPTCNLPSGESLVRQLLYGQRWLRARASARRCRVYWSPDTFGYNGQLPADPARRRHRALPHPEARRGTSSRTPPHDSFRWRGHRRLARCSSHLPPADTYNAELTVGRAARGRRRASRTTTAAATSLLAVRPRRRRRRADAGDARARAPHGRPAAGCPRVELGAQRRASSRGSRTSSATAAPVVAASCTSSTTAAPTRARRATKRGNRAGERLLHEAEAAAALAAPPRAGGVPGRGAARAVARRCCCNQFHDILPGSSIREVYEDAARDLARGGGAGDAAARRGDRRARGRRRPGRRP